ncbi:MAG: hypothetical protein H6707_07005 [Deltaproteobacteria bacterium]|nr:hypothetical protein [Deltaproteobacteria bacterium]
MKRREKRLFRAALLQRAASSTPREPSRLVAAARRYRAAADYSDWDEATDTDPNWCRDPDDSELTPEQIEELVKEAMKMRP